MKRIIILCVCFAMSMISAVAQCNCSCGSKCCACSYSDAYYPFTYNGETIQFNGEDALVAVNQLFRAKNCYFLNIDNAENQAVCVYKLKPKGEYLIQVGTHFFYYRGKQNDIATCRFYQFKSLIRKEIHPAIFNKEGFVLGKSSNEQPVLAIYAN